MPIRTERNDRSEMTAHQRAGWIVILLLQGNRLTTAEIARLTGLSRKGAEYMMTMLALLPWRLRRDRHGKWQVD